MQTFDQLPSASRAELGDACGTDASTEKQAQLSGQEPSYGETDAHDVGPEAFQPARVCEYGRPVEGWMLKTCDPQPNRKEDCGISVGSNIGRLTRRSELLSHKRLPIWTADEQAVKERTVPANKQRIRKSEVCEHCAVSNPINSPSCRDSDLKEAT
ncbi:unnamed protein product [Protopolystoma xenopodis]|uniref:Uncharacterized protein n=1 Tax=Protopolystoma xenopodis TaxID=117903 RepID=A0A448XIG3_9PLAT|nr:unnamed protein product [Protopolystoma xenopodis]